MFGVEKATSYTSNEIIVSGLAEGASASFEYMHFYGGQCDSGSVYLNGKKQLADFGKVVNGDRVKVDLTNPKYTEYAACIFRIKKFRDMFALSALPPDGVPHSEGTKDNPVDLNEETFFYQGQVGTTTSYYKYDNVYDELYMQFTQLTELIGISFYTNPDFSGEPLCSSPARELDLKYIDNCDIEEIDTIYIKIDGACETNGAFFQMHATV